MLSAYSAVNQGHRHPKIIQSLKDQADKLTLTSRAFHSDRLGPWYEKVCKLSGKEMALPMNTGAEAVETAIKAARRWAYDVKGVEDDKAEIIAMNQNFHGRTLAAVSLSSEPEYRYISLLVASDCHFGDIEQIRSRSENTHILSC